MTDKIYSYVPARVYSREEKEAQKKYCGLKHLPTNASYELRGVFLYTDNHRYCTWPNCSYRILFAACDEIEALSAELDKLKAALTNVLKPFADAGAVAWESSMRVFPDNPQAQKQSFMFAMTEDDDFVPDFDDWQKLIAVAREYNLIENEE